MLSAKSKPLLAALLLFCASAAADEAGDAIRRVIIDGRAEQGPRNVIVNFAGMPTRGKLVSADDKGLAVVTSGVQALIEWDKLTPPQLITIARAYAVTGKDHLAIARYQIANDMLDDARETCSKAVEVDKSVAKEAGELIDSITEDRNAAMKEIIARRQERAEQARKDREARIAEALARRNHEGRILPPLPKFTEPVLCDTPEADRIMSSLQIFPPNSHWNTDISKLPVLPNSDQLCANLARTETGRAAAEFTYIIVPPNQPRVKVTFDPYPAECDQELYPIPDNFPMQGWADQFTGTGDRHAFIVDPWNMRVYEMYHTYRTADGWKAFGCIFDLSSNKLRARGRTSADAAGMPMFPCFVRYDECERGMVEHAMRCCVPITRNEMIYPATHRTNTGTDPNLPAMGQRFRLKADVDISGFSKHAKAMALGLKKYGFFVTDNGDNLAICAIGDKRLQLRDIRKLKKTDFEAVDTSLLPVPK